MEHLSGRRLLVSQSLQTASPPATLGHTQSHSVTPSHTQSHPVTPSHTQSHPVTPSHPHSVRLQVTSTVRASSSTHSATLAFTISVSVSPFCSDRICGVSVAQTDWQTKLGSVGVALQAARAASKAARLPDSSPQQYQHNIQFGRRRPQAQSACDFSCTKMIGTERCAPSAHCVSCDAVWQGGSSKG